MNVLFKASPAGLSLKLYIFNSFRRRHDGTWSGEVKLLLCIQTKQLSCNHSLLFCVLSSSGSTVTLRGYKVFRGKNTFQGRGERDVRRIRKPRFSLSKGIWRTAAEKRENDMNNCKVSNMGSGRDTRKLRILWYAPFLALAPFRRRQGIKRRLHLKIEIFVDWCLNEKISGKTFFFW